MEAVRRFHSAYDRHKDCELRREECIQHYLKLTQQIKCLRTQGGWSKTALRKLVKHRENRRSLLRKNRKRGYKLSDNLTVAWCKVEKLTSICITSVEDLDEALWLMRVNIPYGGTMRVKAESKQIKQQIRDSVRMARIWNPVAVQALKLKF